MERMRIVLYAKDKEELRKMVEKIISPDKFIEKVEIDVGLVVQTLSGYRQKIFFNELKGRPKPDEKFLRRI